ncbi:hypothetical protein ARMA_1194 [Ardenticatena maritima]|uniref:Pyridoxal phosphate-dependent aminotransferase n=1 Tax=Ardenticatena maritima TaxID=872965 RepID=A0A0M8K848_9CHLR|nr:DegT/DnrJ/EryC1/StrS aminotransferase family protein [Ardenticatena maritima]KPL88297.1 pyridoxal phosphate-dependent aminotransferase [Ardenticatena maritima]GAP62771.1 hypothetical protein ARMA_1194 [Ardenticatena maritima]
MTQIPQETNWRRADFLPYARADITEAEIAEVVDTLRSGWLSMGPKTIEFEKRFAAYTNATDAIAVNSCTAGLHLALAALGIGDGDEVITTPLTFAATANVAVHLGARPVFADVRADDFNIDPHAVERAITPRTRAIIPVHMAGHPCRMDELLDIAAAHNLPIVEDAAHAVGARYRGKMIGSIGTATAFSFYVTKNLTTGEGGMVTTNDADLAETMRTLRLHGMNRDAWARYSDKGTWYYEITAAGYKYNMTDIAAAIGLHQLRRLNDFIEVRRHYAALYNEAFADMDTFVLPTTRADVEHAWHLYILRLRPETLRIDRAAFIEKLREANIGTSVHFIPVHLHPYYRDTFGYQRGDFPVAEAIFDQAISLPLYTTMTEEDVFSVIEATRAIAHHYRR